MSEPEVQGVLGLEGPPQPLQITNFPLLDQPWSAWSALAGTALCGAVAGYIASSPLMGGALAAALGLALWRVWLPVRFEFGPTGVTQVALGRVRTAPWTRIARYDVRKRGVLLLGADDPSPLAALHGLYVRWGDKRETLLAVLKYYLEPPDTARMLDSTRTSK